MVSLAVGETSYPCLEGLADAAESLRNSALWFPEIPDKPLHLNESSFTGADTPVSKFRPLCYTLFGGSGITSFQALTEISVLFESTSLMMIDFHYDTGEIRRLGRQCTCNPLSVWEQTSAFHVDGAHGEVIKTIEVDLIHGPKWKMGRLRSFKVSDFLEIIIY